MRSSKSRSRNKSNRQRSIGNIVNRVFDSSGPEGKVRGTPQQIIEKYLALARDAQLGNDRVAEQNFLQHAEHYTRMLGEAQRELAREQEERNRQYQQNGNGNGGNGGNGNNGNGNGGNREREQREPREPAEPRYDEQPRFEEAAIAMPEPIEDDEGPGLVETPEAQQAEAAAEPAVTEGAEKPKSSRSRSRTRKPKAEKAEGGEGGDTPEAPAEAPQAE